MRGIYFLVFCLISVSSFCQPAFEKFYSSDKNIYGAFVQQTIDGGYIICGGNEMEIHLVKTNYAGETEWSKIITDTVYFGSEPIESGSARCIKQTSDGGYILSGYIEFPLGMGAYALKLDRNGNKLWSHKIAPSGWAMMASAIHEIPGAGYIFNYYNNGELSSNSFGYFKTDFNGQNLQKTYISQGGSAVNNFEKTADNSFISMVYNEVDNVKYIQKIGLTSTLWKKETSLDLSSIKELPNGSFIGGTCLKDENNNNFIGIVKYNNNGDSLWSCSFTAQAAEYLIDVTVIPDGGYCLLSNTGTSYQTGRDVRLTRITESGQILWTKIFGGEGLEYAANLIRTTDGGFAFTGSREINDQKSMYFVKVNSNGDFTPTLTKENSKALGLVQIIPNPCQDFTFLNLPEELLIDGEITLEIFDVTGKLSLSSETNEKSTRIYTGELSPGIYFYRLKNSRKALYHGKLILTD